MNDADKALALLREHGWCRGDWENAKGEHCIAGALAVVGGTLPMPGWWTPARPVVEEVIREQYGVHGFVGFNDSPRHTFTDIERVLEKASVRLDEFA